MKRRLFKTVALALVMTLAATTAAFAAVPSDVTGQPYEKAVEALMDKGIITGDRDGLFHSNDNLTRAQACVIVVKAMKAPSADVVGTPTQKAPTSGFSDMKGYGWADGYVAYAVAHGITKGVGNNKFAPQEKVKVEELATMLLRAAGNKDLEGTWPANYMTKAEELGMFKDLGEVSKLPNPATKALAAQLTYHVIDKIEASIKDNANGNSNSTEFVPGTTKVTFATGSFNDTITTYAGKAISKDVVVYTYGKKVNYKSDMQLPTNKADYRLDTINKFKNEETPCFYYMADGKIVAMVVPMDAGFNGIVYGVINSVSGVMNGDKEQVKSLDTLAAGKKISWLTKSDSIKGLPTSNSEFLKGDIFEMVTKNGTVKEMYKSNDAGRNKDFAELTKNDFTDTVGSFDKNVVKLANGSAFEVAANADVYLLSEDGKEYSVGNLNDIRKDVKIRAYDIKDDSVMASIVVIQKK